MKRVVLSLMLFLGAGQAMAQCPIEVGQKQINAGFGMSSWGIPIYIGADYGFRPDITVGGEINTRSFDETLFATKYEHSVTGVIGNANYHFSTMMDLPSELDVYVGLNVGFYLWKSTNSYPGTHKSGLAAGVQAGARYYFSKNWAANIEVAGGYAALGGKLGISYRIPKKEAISEVK